MRPIAETLCRLQTGQRRQELRVGEPTRDAFLRGRAKLEVNVASARRSCARRHRRDAPLPIRQVFKKDARLSCCQDRRPSPPWYIHRTYPESLFLQVHIYNSAFCAHSLSFSCLLRLYARPRTCRHILGLRYVFDGFFGDSAQAADLRTAENCSPSCNMTGYDIVNNIREIAHSYGSVTQFKAYLELSEQSSKSTTLRSELQSCGVSLTDCPHNGRKDVADKMMIGGYLLPSPYRSTSQLRLRLPDTVDMLTYALDTPAPATIVLISGDRDFVYAVSVLRLRRYRVVLVAPQQAHNSLKSQATTVLDWSTDVLGKEKPSGLPTPGESSRSVHRRSQSSATPAIAPGSPFAAKSQRRLSFGLPAQRPGGEPLQSAPNSKSPRAPVTPLQEAWTPADEHTPDTSRSHSSLLRPQVPQTGLPTPLSEPASSKLSLKTSPDCGVDLEDSEVDIADLNLHLKNLTNRSSSNNSPSVSETRLRMYHRIVTLSLCSPISLSLL